MNIPYFAQTEYYDELDVEDIGNCCIEANNDEGVFWYLVVRTNLGKTQIFQYGPIVPDIELFPSKVECTFERIDFDAKKIKSYVSKFLNTYTKKITQAKIISIDEALDSCRSIVDYMKNFDISIRY